VTIVTIKILLVDDCLEDRETYRRYLLGDNQHTYSILETETGEEGLELCQQQFPDVILLDYLLPDMDGLEFLNELKTQLGQTNLPVIILTGQGDEQVAVQAMKSGAADYLVKRNTTSESLCLAIENVLERTRLRRQLLESEKRFQATFNQAAVGIAHVGLAGQWLLVNQKLCDIVGYTREELNRLTFQDITHPDDLNTDLEYVRRILAGEIETYSLEKRYIRKDNTYIWINLTVSLVREASGEPKYFISVIQDITARKQAQAALQQAHAELERRVQERTSELQQANEELHITLEELQVAEEELRQQNEELAISHQAIKLERQRYQDLFEFAPDGYLVTDTQGNIREANRTAATLLSIQQQRLIGKPLFVFIANPERQAFQTRFAQLQPMQNWEVYLKPHKGDPFPATIALSSIHDEQGQQVGWRWLLRDISDRKQAEQKIREQAALLDVTTDAIFVRDLECRILYWNRGAERLYGWQAAEVLGRNCYEFLCKQISAQIEEAFRTVVEQGEWQGELKKIAKSGQEIIVQSRWTLMRDGAGQPKSILAVDTDITEKKQLQQQFYRVQRLESLGTLASGIAHDLNNILTPILAVAQLLPLKLPYLDEQNRQLLKILEDNSKRGADLVKQILSFARGAEGKRIPLQPRHLLKEIERIVKNTFPKSIEICIDIPTPNLWTVSADPTQIHQVLMNLCVNARDAMPNGGTLTISAENLFVDENYARMNLEAKVGDYVVITVSDTGCGMPQEVLERIFEPFFTTKEPGKGTGLGLSTVIGIIKNHGGFINVYSEVGKGSQFKLYLSASDTRAILSADDSEMARGNGELILVVDDEVSVRDVTKASLLNYNYRVLNASDGIEAFSLYAQHKNEISLVLMDMQMPSMDGLNAIRVLQQMNPSIKIIAISGLASNLKLLKASGIGVQAFLLKPYTIKELLNTIKQVFFTHFY
jgi:PAS domain S-box-containing protein